MYAEYMVKQEARNNLAKNNWSKAVAITIFYLTLITSTTLLSQLIQETLKIDLNGKFTSFFSEFTDISINQGVLINSFKNAGTTNIIIYYSFLLLILLLTFVVLLPLSLGFLRFYFSVSKGELPSVSEIFYYFIEKKRFLRALSFGINAALRVIFWTLICILPGIIMITVSTTSFVTNTVSGDSNKYFIIFEIIAMILLVVGYIFLTVIALRYFLSSYLLISREEMSVKDCFKVSFKGMVGHRISVLKLYITFLPWILSCFFVLPILYVIPYFQTAKFICAKWLLAEIEKKDNSNNAPVETFIQ